MDKTYELSISKDYVSNWDVKDAIREILQNAIDSEKMGNSMSIEYEDGVLKVSNYGAKLESSSLVLGCGSKTNDASMIGGFSEGYKLALTVLLREGYEVIINNNDEQWCPEFKYSDSFKTETLTVSSKTINHSNNLEFSISPIDEDLYDELCQDFPCILGDNYGEYIDTEFGKVLLDDKFKGKMFVEGLFVQEDGSFEYGYDFLARFVQLDRDRKAINYYSLKELAASLIFSASSCSEEIYRTITKGNNPDVEDIIDVLTYATDEFLSEFKDMTQEDLEIDDDTILATKEKCKYLEGMGYKTKVSTERISNIYAKALNKKSILDEVDDLLSSKSDKQRAWENLKGSDFLWLMKFATKLDESYKNELISHLKERPAKPTYFNYIKDDFWDNYPESINESFIEDKIEELEI